MIVIGVDVHKHELTAVAVDGLGRAVAERTSAFRAEPLLEWARSLGAERLWAPRGLSARDARLRTGAARRRRAAGAGTAALDGARAPARPHPRQVGRNRRARDRTGGAAGTGPRPPPGRRGAAAGAEAAGRPPRRPRRRAAPLPAAAALAPTRARSDTGGAAGCTRPQHLARAARPAAPPTRADDPGTDRAGPARPLPRADPLAPRARPRAADA